ncbi:serine--tRNA ligase [Imperialibacter roseus]|uniref:Serine--tRNA ligase n=1 Tax=Imperialibacter roseus TaxID=1324217 RepID=A0ABZ0INV7_9BACT|nr:serine--tRNA ligase [Imperialibacter roseus]WOK06718.1 serine--tRNA ligase [Imperialibacter roseus]|tara:strand:+ start:32289 stop:33563 length:1275 start_codon:yes stop_codon:yes gene_type:complete
MLQVSEIRANKEKVLTGLKKRGLKEVDDKIDEVLALDDKRKSLKTEMDVALAEANQLAKQIGQLMQSGQKEAAEKIKSQTSELKETSKKLGSDLESTEELLTNKLYELPNVPHESVPEGRTAEDNEVVFQVGTLPKLPESAKPHWDLIKEYDIIDFDLGIKITGAGFPVYKKQGARIVRAMINYFIDQALDAGYLEMRPPIVVNKESGYGTGQLPDKEGQMYHATADDLYLIPTAEVPITNLYRDVILADDELPVKNVAYTPCFRREAGSWGAHVRGLNRLHQFDKVEIVQVTTPEASYKALDGMKNHVERLIKNLELPYRILKLCGGDMGFTSALTFDFEVYSAAQKKWLEVSSVSNFETYQANRLKLRRKVDKKTELLHTLNGSALALPRILAAMLENNQTPDGIKIPKVLVPYTGFNMIKK